MPVREPRPHVKTHAAGPSRSASRRGRA